MKKLILTTLLPLAVFANAEGEKYSSYNYFSIGSENIAYNEDITTSSGDVVHSEAKATSPVYLSGMLGRVNDTFDFSIDMSSTLLPTQASETWNVNSALAQQNQFDAMISSMQILGHYKMDNKNRVVFGPTYKLNSFKRYNFKDQYGNTLLDSDGAKLGLIQERVATLYATVGYWFESGPHASADTIRYKLNAVFGLPIWNSASNTGFEKVTFNSTNGYKFEGNAYMGYPIYKGLELGLFAGYSYQKKSGTDVASDGHTKWPANNLTILQTGLSLVWNLSKN